MYVNQYQLTCTPERDYILTHLVSPTSVLSPIRLVLEALCKLCIHDKNVDMLLASPPYERIVQIFIVLTKLLANKSE